MNELQLICNLRNIQASIPKHTTLVAVSKYHTIDEINTLYQAGQRVFGESRAQELIAKYEALPKDINWHFIGNLQSNKVKQIVPIVSTIHSVHSIDLLKEINRQAEKQNRTIDCLIEIHIAQEETKQGFSLTECEQIFAQKEISQLMNIRVCGVMGMATFTNNTEQIRSEFKTLNSAFQLLQNTFFPESSYFKHLSMGMSNDYSIAIEEGSTIVRIGSLLFDKG